MKKKNPIRRKIRTLYADVRVWMRYGTLTPDFIRLPACDYLLRVDPHEQRARNLLIRDVVRGKIPQATKIWRSFARHINPTLVIDVGVNYGECILGSVYSPGCALFGFEANPTIFKLIEQSVLNHPNCQQFSMHNVIVSETSGPAQTFFVNPEWSGTSSAVKSVAAIEHQVQVGSLDKILPAEACSGARCLFKIDIEGYEGKALRGFHQALEKMDSALGVIEFDTQRLAAAGDDPVALLAELSERFEIYCITSKQRNVLREVRSLEDLPMSSNSSRMGRRHVDLVLIKNGGDRQLLVPPHFTFAPSTSSL